MTDINPGQGTIVVQGVPFSLMQGFGGDDYITATSQTLILQGSPLVVTFDPPVPVADIDSVGVPQIEAALAQALGQGGGNAKPDDGPGGPPTPPTGPVVGPKP